MDAFERLQAEIGAVRRSRPVGRIVEIGRGTLHVTGLSQEARLGDRVRIGGRAGGTVAGEVVHLTRERATVLTETPAEGVEIGRAHV